MIGNSEIIETIKRFKIFSMKIQKNWGVKFFSFEFLIKSHSKL